jgi:hypothetical protein
MNSSVLVDPFNTNTIQILLQRKSKRKEEPSLMYVVLGAGRGFLRGILKSPIGSSAALQEHVCYSNT